MMNIIDKMDKENGKAAVIHNGSPLFTGDAGSGQAILENIFLNTICLMQLLLFQTIFFTTQELQHTFGFLIITKPKIEKIKYS